MSNAARLSQHFLADENARDAIVAAAFPAPGKRILEIGPGRGALTRSLLDSGAAVTAVELDDRLYASLLEKLAPRGLALIHADFLDLDLARLSSGPFTVVANLPYAVGAPILQKLLPWPGWTEAVLMFQKEVALRLCAQPGGPDYGLLTLSTLLWAQPDYLLEVPRASFRPPPQVDAGVVRLVRRPQPLVPEDEQPAFFRLAKAAFGQRRKMAAAVIASALQRPRKEVETAFADLGVPAAARPENIPFEAFAALTERFKA